MAENTQCTIKYHSDIRQTKNCIHSWVSLHLISCSLTQSKSILYVLYTLWFMYTWYEANFYYIWNRTKFRVFGAEAISTTISFTHVVGLQQDGTRYKPLHHLARTLVHANHVSFLWYCIQEGIFPKLHLVPQCWAFLPYQACHNNSSLFKAALNLCAVSIWEPTNPTGNRNEYMFLSLCTFRTMNLGLKY
jgi:hypothetical protein